MLAALPRPRVATGGGDVLHGVVDGHAGGDGPARRIDVHVDFLFRVLGLQEKQLRADQAGHVIVDGAAEQDDPVLEEAE